MAKSPRWTDEELEILKNNYSSMQVHEFINLLSNRSEQSVHGKASRLGLKRLKVLKYTDVRSDISDEDIISIFNEGKSRSEIARILGIAVSTVTNRLKRNNIKLEKKVLRGEECYNWKGGITSENDRIRNSQEYRYWRNSVYELDNYTCQCCGDSKGGNLSAHHIENFSEYEDKRFDIDNGITLCDSCHSPSIKGSFHHIYGTHNNTREQLNEYISNHKVDQPKSEFVERYNNGEFKINYTINKTINWTKEEVELLEINYPILKRKELSIILPNRSYRSVYRKAEKLGLKKYREFNKDNEEVV